MRLTKNLGMLLLGVYLILIGLGGLISLNVPGTVMAILALAAGVLILLGR